jgi:cell division protein FtsI/penicillin-binding protein 2
MQLLTDPLAGCTTPPEAAESVRVIDKATAEQLLTNLPSYGEAVGYLGTSLAGPDRRQAWFIGLSSASLPRYGVVVLIDHADRPEQAAEIGTQLLRRVLEIHR